MMRYVSSMMIKTSLPFTFVVLVGACVSLLSCKQSRQPAQKDSVDTVGQQPVYQEPARYNYTQNGDTVSLIIQPIANDSISGSLVYKLAGKDLNEGTVKGKFNGDTLLMDYVFRSEGVESVREVAFKRVNGKLEEGYGPVSTGNDTVRFTSPDSLKFGKGVVLSYRGY